MNLRKEYGLIKEKLILLKMERNKTEEMQLQINLIDTYLSVLLMRINKECPEFNLVEFLKANLVHTEFKKGDKVRYFSYDDESKHPLRYHIQTDQTIGTVYFTDSLDDEVVEVLNDNGVTARDLVEAFKELGWM